ncbi:uncharacterized protein LOC142584686 [Dermacentor variabilis]|uniref:uncharacterized protein LOC142584686 n=1 Tax=Dermacentor variabilis TaxID=34621 RepID=UPI003F5BA2A2
MRLATDISCLLSTGVQQSTRTRNLLMRQVAVVLELRSAACDGSISLKLSQYCSSQNSAFRHSRRTWRTVSLSSHLPQVGGSFPVQKSMVEAVAKVPTRKDSQYKRVHTTDLYYRGWTAHRAPST